MHTITLSGGEKFPCSEDQTILEAAKKAGLFLEHSCKTGRCGSCIAEFFGKTKLLREEQFSKINLNKNQLLTCCRAPKSDLTLKAEDLSELSNYPSKTVPCKIDHIRRVVDDVVEVFFRIPPSAKLIYLPGQYIDVIHPSGVKRSYSIANAQMKEGRFSLHIKRVKKGIMSQYWFNEAKVNDLLRIEGPLGSFFLRKKKEENLILLATGTGIAPIKAILEDINTNIKLNLFKDIYLYWGGRFIDNLYWNPELQNIKFKYFPVISQGKPEVGLREGYVQDNVIKDKINLSRSVVYACGSEIMINAARRQLFEHGLPIKNFYSDAFVSSNQL
jgi:CDP-4-dehydro-6-deoxyglucose reductase, E3